MQGRVAHSFWKLEKDRKKKKKKDREQEAKKMISSPHPDSAWVYCGVQIGGVQIGKSSPVKGLIVSPTLFLGIFTSVK